MENKRSLDLLDELVEEAMKLLSEAEEQNKRIIKQTRKITSLYLEIMSKGENMYLKFKNKTGYFIFGLVTATVMQERGKEVNLSKDEIRSSMAGMISGSYYLISKMKLNLEKLSLSSLFK